LFNTICIEKHCIRPLSEVVHSVFYLSARACNGKILLQNVRFSHHSTYVELAAAQIKNRRQLSHTCKFSIIV